MNKSPERRRQIILETLEKTGRLDLEDIAQTLNVSAMTLNRDVRQLAEQGLVKRLHGAIILPDEDQGGGVCVVCHRPVSVRVQFLSVSTKGKTTQACCPHCGFANLEAFSQSKAIFATDFLYGTLYNAYEVTYLIGSRIAICCSPSVLAFQHREDAQSFQTGFGGEMLDLENAVNLLFH
jgi:DeoR family transcriptional regulator, copper-sensing transcriptional repressor